MNVIASILAVTLAVQGVSSESPCKITDNACKAQDFERRADQTADPTMRAWRLHSAHRSYLFLFDETGNVEHLCASRRMYEQSIAVKNLPASERAGLTARLAELETRERQHRPRCGKKVPRPRHDPPLLTSASSKKPPSEHPTDASADDILASPGLAPVAEVSTGVAAPAHSEPLADPVAAPVTSSAEAPAAGVAPPLRLEPHGDPLLPVRRSPPPARRDGRPLVIVGSGTMLGGLALAGAAGFIGARLVDIRHQGQALADAVDGYGSAEEVAQDAALRGAYRRTGAQTVALAVSAGALLIIGGVLTGIGARRMARVVSRTALLPAPGGLALRVRF